MVINCMSKVRLSFKIEIRLSGGNQFEEAGLQLFKMNGFKKRS